MFSLGLNLIFILGIFLFKDLKRILKNWYLLKFKISKKDLIRVTFFNSNKRIHTKFVRVKDGLITWKDSGETYNADESKIVHDEDGLPNLFYVSGNALPLDMYDKGKKGFASAKLQDAAIKMAMVAAEAGPLFEFIAFVRKWVPYLAIALIITACIMGVLLFVVFDMAGNISAAVKGGTVFV